MKSKSLMALVITGVLMLPNAAYAKGNDKGENNKTHITETSKDKNNNSNKTDNSSENSAALNAATTSQAAQTAKADNKGSDKKDANEAKKTAKTEEIQSFKAEMKTKHAALAQLRQEITPIRQQVEAKTAELTSLMEDIQAGKKTLPEDMLNNLIALTDALKADGASIKDTYDAASAADSVQAAVNNQSFNNALASMDKVIAKFQQRLAALEKLNSDLDAALQIARTATEVTAENTTTTTDSTDTSGTTSDNSNTSTTTNDQTSPNDTSSTAVEGN